MKILAVNCGSSSLKFQLADTDPERMERNEDQILARGLADKIGAADSALSVELPGSGSFQHRLAIPDHTAAFRAAVSAARLEGVEAVGHRMVHGGGQAALRVRMDEEVVRSVEAACDLAPLHNPHNLKGYYAARALFPAVPHVAVFDTAFHQTLPRCAYTYALPYDMLERHRLRRYGFHGTSHRYVTARLAHLLGRKSIRLISCHLGNGCSICAVRDGKSVDTSMGFTPLEGLVMGTRPGDVDAGALLHLAQKEGLGLSGLAELLNKRSGLLGLSGLSNDMRALLQACERGDDRARLAIDVFCYRAKKYIGAYYAVLNGADGIIFTGGIGERAPQIRAQICASLEALGVSIDPARNEAAIEAEMDISSPDSTTRVWVIPTNEELLISRETALCLLGLP